MRNKNQKYKDSISENGLSPFRRRSPFFFQHIKHSPEIKDFTKQLVFVGKNKLLSVYLLTNQNKKYIISDVEGVASATGVASQHTDR